MVGRRVVLAICMPLSTLLLVGVHVGGSTMWLLALVGGVLGGAAYPAFTVYRTELFPTGNRGRANGFITALSLAGSSVGLLLVGALVHRGWSYGESMLLVGLRPAARRGHRIRRLPRDRAPGARADQPGGCVSRGLRSTTATIAAIAASEPFRSWPRALDPVVGDLAGNRRRPLLQLVGRAERIAGAVDEQARHRQPRQVLDAQRVGLARRVQRIRDQHQTAAGSGSSASPTAIEQIRPPIDRPPSTSPSASKRRSLVAHRLQQHRRAVGRLAAGLAIREVGAHAAHRRHRRLDGQQAGMRAADEPAPGNSSRFMRAGSGVPRRGARSPRRRRPRRRRGRDGPRATARGTGPSPPSS